MSKEAIGRRLALTREALGFDEQAAFAEAAGIATNTYNQYEQGVNRPSLDNALKIRNRFSLTLDWIYLGDNSSLRYEIADKIRNLRAKNEAAKGL